MRLVHIADSDDVTETAGVLRVPLPHPAAADEGNAGAIVRTDGPPGPLICLQFALDEPQRQPRCSGKRRAGREKRTAGDLKWFVHDVIQWSQTSCAYTFALSMRHNIRPPAAQNVFLNLSRGRLWQFAHKSEAM